MSNVEFEVRRQAEAARSLLAGMRGEDDPELIADTIEGETSLIEALANALDEMDECDVLDMGLTAKIEQLTDRQRKVRAMKDRIQTLIEQAMVSTDQMSLKLPTATLSLVKRQPGVVLLNEADIPARFWAEQERPAPKLDKRALGDALRSDERIPGASLDNGSVSLTIRRK